jgi:hypothetical protein
VDAWDGWVFARLYMLLVALAFAVIGAQVFLFHWRAAFHKWTMYLPVLAAPVIVAADYLAHPDTWERIGFNGPAYPGLRLALTRRRRPPSRTLRRSGAVMSAPPLSGRRAAAK